MVKKIRMISAVGIIFGVILAYRHDNHDNLYSHFIIGGLIFGVSGFVYVVVCYFSDKE